jgi:hypothetical protein
MMQGLTNLKINEVVFCPLTTLYITTNNEEWAEIQISSPPTMQVLLLHIPEC